jgi:pimeloyl-ACP methyl ester carboxylesterase
MHAFDEWELDLHGHRTIYRIAGSGPPVVLIHGMVNSSRHWERVALQLAERHTVIAPDLLGHGDSATPRGDYSLGAHAAVIRDVLSAIGVDRATIVGHSLGGGVAMQFFWQFPHRTERLVLVSSGGLGQEVSPLLRSMAVPGIGFAVAAAAHPAVVRAIGAAGPQGRVVARALRPLSDPGARRAFLETLRAVIDVRGQRVSAADRLYLLDAVPTLIVWGGRDNTIPIDHGLAAHRAIPHSRFETLPSAAHFPHIEDPEGLAGVLADFLTSTPPAHLDTADWHELVAPRSQRRRRMAAVA